MAANARKAKAQRILCFDVGGTGLKAAIIGPNGRFIVPRLRVKTPPRRTPDKIVPLLVDMARKLGRFDHVTIGFPGMVRHGHVISAPAFGTKDWHGFNLGGEMRKRLKKPVKLLNDADVQGLAVIKGKGLELVCTLGTGFGTAWFRDGELLPHMELAHIPFHKGKDLDQYLGEKAREKAGNKKWNKRLAKVIAMLSTVMNYDHLYFGGGNSEHITLDLPRNISIVSNRDGLKGAAFAWFPKAAAG